MNIKSMLLRLQDVLGCDDLSQIVLLPEPTARAPLASAAVNLVVGYDGSPKSQTALDLALWIAHQTRLVQRQQVVVQVVYVVSISPEQWQQADHVLWQARCLAEEWRGAFKTHLRVGNLAIELQRVAISEAATLLILGCHTAQHPLIQTLNAIDTPCVVLGIPQPLAVRGNQASDIVNLEHQV